MKNGCYSKVLLCGALSLVASSAFAHPGHDVSAAASLASGLLHPLTGADHLLVMLTVGVWSALGSKSPATALRLPAVFVALMVAGFAAGLIAPGVSAVEPMIAASLLVLGALVALRAQLPAWAGMSIVGGFALFHGYAHGADLPAAASVLAYGAGFVATTATLHATGLGLGAVARRYVAWLAPVAGTGVALYGISLLAA
ncbi:MAG: HupE/UreJ family protein [Aromatoleum sp.]|jgi:urease accessory protein|uniref:HupE/UreJ family protein n=1 Tax=Aromatoleum sp. TaxID=2307007 RepID=UPI00289397CC|nr:HupE/UreJ family protein [Aromatoleum sp.]MDT3669433.1 HupE/UreJ family protein [Aromatoleum sp.]